ncbi:MAG: fimbrillin family protein [Bacteroidales bacterium]|nr:fimbrillin family protein [Bacteroidales bacterium]
MKTLNISTIVSISAVAMLFLAGCARIDEPGSTGDKGLTDLELSAVKTDDMLSRAVVDGTVFPVDGKIGLSLFADVNATEAYREESANVEYSYDGAKGKWVASPAIRVGSKPGYLFGYYPYSQGNTDIKAIPVSSSLDGDDVMYAAAQNAITDETARGVSVTMKHALARVSIKVKNSGYAGEAKLGKIVIAGGKTSRSGILDAVSGEIRDAQKTDVSFEVPEAVRQITPEGTVYECLVVPSEVDTAPQDVTLTLTVDGQEKTVPLTGDNALTIASGVKCGIVATLTNTGIVVGSVSVDGWQTVDVGEYKVSLALSGDAADAGIASDVFIQTSSDATTAIVSVLSDSGKPLVLRREDGTPVAPEEQGNKSTFTISGIDKDIAVTLAYARTFKITEVLKTDVQTEETYLAKYTVEPISVLEGRNCSLTAGEVPGFRCQKMVCGDCTAEGNTIAFECVMSDAVVDAFYEYTDYPLTGEFTVSSDGRKVRFAKGNMWYEKGFFHNEAAQYLYSKSNPAWAADGRLSNFFWVDDPQKAVQLHYSASGNRFFTNDADNQTEADSTFSVNGQKGKWRVLTGGRDGEWNYLLSNHTHKSNVTVCGERNCMVILPDGWQWGNGLGSRINGEYSDTTTPTWAAMEAAGAVCLPAAGIRSGVDIPGFIPFGQLVDRVNQVVVLMGLVGQYWSATPTDNTHASCFSFFEILDEPYTARDRYWAFSVRLVQNCR